MGDLENKIKQLHLPNPFNINGVLSIVSLIIYCEIGLFLTPIYWRSWSSEHSHLRINLVSYRQDARELLHWLDCRFELVDPTVQDINKQGKSIRNDFFLPLLANHIDAGCRVRQIYGNRKSKPKPQDMIEELNEYIDHGPYSPKLRKLVTNIQDRDDAWFGWAGPIPFTIRQRNQARTVSLGSIDGTIPQDVKQLKSLAYKIKEIKKEKDV